MKRQGRLVVATKQVLIGIFARLKQPLAGYEVRKYLSSCIDPKINVGCQTNYPAGWINVDLYPRFKSTYMNATSRWPFADNTLSAVLCEHMIEHVSKTEAFSVLSEAYRTCKPGATIRVITPNLLEFARMVLNPESKNAQLYVQFSRNRQPVATVCDAVNNIFYGFRHRYIYSPMELSGVLEKIGFVGIRETPAGLPVNSVFEGVEGHPKLMGQEVNAIEAFALEARKPL